MQTNDKTYSVALMAVAGIGRVTFNQILFLKQKLQVSWPELWHKLSTHPALFALNVKQVAGLQLFKKHYTPADYSEWLASQQIVTLTNQEAEYPFLLKQIPDYPPVLFVKGNLKILANDAVAVVGTRHITQYGTLVTSKITRELVELGMTIVSGFMYGVDVTAHQVTIQAGGQTIGVLGFGFGQMYPAAHRTLFTRFLEQGQIFLTEYAPEVEPSPGTFPARNRLIAGLSHGVVVTEAAADSGSHITAECAVEYGRSVYAVPGPITNPFTEGTKGLLKEGALCVSTGREVVEDLGLLQNVSKSLVPLDLALEPLAKEILNCIAAHPQTTESLIQHLKYDLSQVVTTLSYLEIQGLILQKNQGWYRTA